MGMQNLEFQPFRAKIFLIYRVKQI